MAMDALVVAALDEISLEGPSGEQPSYVVMHFIVCLAL